MCMFTVSSCVWVRNGIEILRGPRTIIKYKSIILRNKYMTLYSVYNICIILGLILLLCCSSVLVCWVVSHL